MTEIATGRIEEGLRAMSVLSFMFSVVFGDMIMIGAVMPRRSREYRHAF